MEDKVFDAVLKNSLGVIETVRAALAEGFDINTRNSDGYTILHLTAKNYESSFNIKLLVFLIKSGADINLKSTNGQTVFQLMDFDWSLGPDDGLRCDALRYMIERGMDVNSRYKTGFTPLHFAVAFGFYNFVKFLLSRGADVNAQDKDGLTPLHLPILDRSIHVMEPLLSTGNFNKQVETNKGLPLLHFYVEAAYEEELEHEEITEYLNALLSFGVDIDMRSRNGQTILHRACKKMDLPMVKFLIKHGADINAVDHMGISPLLEAMNPAKNWDSPDVDLIKYLLKHDADVNIVTKENFHILSYLEDDFYDTDYKILRNIITQRISILYSSGHYIDKKIIKAVDQNNDDESDESYENDKNDENINYFEECIIELQNLRNEKICHVSYFDLLIDSKQKLQNYVKNLNFVQKFNQSKIYSEMKIFGYLIQKRVSKAIIRENSKAMLSSCLPPYIGNNHLIIRKILSYCKSKDLQKLCNQAYMPELLKKISKVNFFDLVTINGCSLKTLNKTNSS